MQRTRHNIWWLVRTAFDNFLRHDCWEWAANIAFYALLALIPLAMIMTSIAGLFLKSSAQPVIDQLIGAILSAVPGLGQEIAANVNSLIEQRSSLGLVGVGFLIVIASFLMASIEHALDIVFQSEKRRNFWHSRLVAIGLVFLSSIIMFIPTMARVLEGGLARYGFVFPLTDLVNSTIFYSFLIFVAYVVVLMVVPSHRVQFRPALVGGLCFSVGVVVAQHIFRAYMVFAFARYSLIYGSLTAVVLYLVWIYYVFLVMLFAAEVAAVLQMQSSAFDTSKRL